MSFWTKMALSFCPEGKYWVFFAAEFSRKRWKKKPALIASHANDFFLLNCFHMNNKYWDKKCCYEHSDHTCRPESWSGVPRLEHPLPSFERLDRPTKLVTRGSWTRLWLGLRWSTFSSSPEFELRSASGPPLHCSTRRRRRLWSNDGHYLGNFF